MFTLFREQERRYYKMLMKIICFILLVHTSTNHAVPAPNDMLGTMRFQRESENGSGDSCCVRRSKLEDLKVSDISGAKVTVDVGECVQCDNSDSSAATNLSLPVITECGSGKECVAKHTSYKTYHLLTGPITKEIVKECNCQGIPSKCKRRKRFITYFEGSSFEQTIDIGECLGACSGFGLNKQCIAIENKTEVISGPNGKICVPVIESCECKSSCYIAPLKEQYLEIFTDENGETQQRWKTIDIGQCIGYCEPSDDGRICLFPQQNPCKIFLEPSNKKNETCVPTQYTKETFISSHQKTKNIFKITECGCKQ